MNPVNENYDHGFLSGRHKNLNKLPIRPSWDKFIDEFIRKKPKGGVE